MYYDSKNIKLEVGSVVSFAGRRGQRVTGTIVRFREKTVRRNGRNGQLLRSLGVSSHALDRTVAEITPDDGRGIWTVGLTSLTSIGRASKKKVAAAVQTRNEVKRKVANRRHERRGDNYEAARDNGLYDLKPGDSIFVEFREGKFERKFVGFTTTGTVRYEQGGRTRTIDAKYVSLPVAKHK